MMRFARSDDAQGLVEFALVVPPIVILLIFGLIELGTLLSDGLTITSASREGARIGGALVNGGGTLGCAASVDPNIVAAVERVLTGSGTRIALSDVTQIRIWKSTATGAETAGQVNVWTYQPGGGPVIDGRALDFAQTSEPWLPCSRTNASPVDSVGVTVVYAFRAQTPLRFFLPYFSALTIADRAVMAMNASR